MKMRRSFVMLTAPVILIGCGGDQPQQGPPPAMPVQVASPIKREIALTEVFTGRFEPVEDVELRARVSGYLQEVLFKEGQQVEKGALMFKIDPRPFQAVVDTAKAQLEQAEAQKALAEGNMKRAETLTSENAMSREELEIRKSEFAQAQADILAAEARLRSAELDLEFCDIKAPISGIAGDYAVTPGNFISGGTPGSTLLSTIVPHHPIHCRFEVDERQVLKFTRMYFEGKTDGRGGEQPEVSIAVSDREEFEFKGVIDFSENRLDEETATTQLRALVQNEDQFLTPGLFARIRVPIGDPFEAILVDDRALGFDQDKRFAWVLQPDKSVKRKYLQTSSLEGTMRIVEEGLTLDDKIVVSGIQMLQDGMPVQPTEQEMGGSLGGEKAAPEEQGSAESDTADTEA